MQKFKIDGREYDVKKIIAIQDGKQIAIDPDGIQKIDLCWSRWRAEVTEDGLIFHYRTRGARTQVMVGQIIGEATCAPGDTYDLEAGIQVALVRALSIVRVNETERLIEKWPHIFGGES